MPKTVKGGPLRSFNKHSVVKYQNKLEEGPFEDKKIFEKKSHKAEKREESHSAKKVRTFCFGILVKKIGAYSRVRTRTLWVEKQVPYH